MMSATLIRSCVVTLLFIGVAMVGAYHHELWRDEIQAWLLVIDAQSLRQLFENCRYEGHPMLWYLLLYGIAQCTEDIVAIQLLSICVTSTAVFLFCRFSPFNWVQKTVFVFGFYPLFQYCILSRSYGVILLFWVCYLCIKPQSVWSWVILVLMANTSATGCVLACCFGTTVVVQEWLQKKSIVSIVKEYAIGLILLGLGLIVAAWQIYPEPDNIYSTHFSGKQLQTVFSQLHDSYFYIAYWPDLFGWSTVHMRDQYPLDLAISIVLFVVCVVLFYQHKRVLFFYVCSTLSMVLLLTVTNMDSARFLGHFFLILMAGYWFTFKEGTVKNKRGLNVLLMCVLGCQLVTGCGLFYADYTQTFSNGKRVAAYIREQKLDSYPITGGLDYTISPISYWLNKPVFYMETRANGRYMVWSNKRSRPLTPELFLHQTDSLVQAQQKAVIIISYLLPVANESFRGFMQDSIASKSSQWVLIKKFEDAMVPDENYYIYLASRKK
ncbi:MAG: hypothetical protein V4590_14860 [Bacteroidota bacterium]